MKLCFSLWGVGCCETVCFSLWGVGHCPTVHLFMVSWSLSSCTFTCCTVVLLLAVQLYLPLGGARHCQTVILLAVSSLLSNCTFVVDRFYIALFSALEQTTMRACDST